MSLIEQLGGYKNAKNTYEKLKSEITDKQKNNKIFMDSLNSLGRELLQYGREHGAFELGDSVVLINGYSDEVHYLSGWYIENLDFRYTKKSGEWGVIVKSSMVGIWRHATPQEIEAGRRLD